MRIDWTGIASRIRGLVRIARESDIVEVANRLGVDERSLRASVNSEYSRPTLDVIAALVRVYGLDPSWVLTGEYDPETHRRVLEDPADIGPVVKQILSRVYQGPLTPRDGLRF